MLHFLQTIYRVLILTLNCFSIITTNLINTIVLNMKVHKFEDLAYRLLIAVITATPFKYTKGNISLRLRLCFAFLLFLKVDFNQRQMMSSVRWRCLCAHATHFDQKKTLNSDSLHK